MSGGPFVFIARTQLLPDALSTETANTPTLIESLEHNESGLLGFNVFADENASEVTSVQIYHDASAMEVHMQVSAEQLAHAYSSTRGSTTQIEVYGEATAGIAAMIEQLKESGAQVALFPRFLGGFVRMTPGPATGGIGRDV